jgi:hypothetical protein
MMGAFHCPHCGTRNACDCKTCRPHIKEGEPIISFTEDGEGLICANCKKMFSHDQAIDEEYRKRTTPWWGYLHISGTLQAKPYREPLDIEEAEQSPFCKKVVGPFQALHRDHALLIVQQLTQE